jgi:hypothetical protein
LLESLGQKHKHNMSSRVSLQHFVSTTEPIGVTVGDEWYNPSTGILYKRIASSLGVQWVNISGLGSSTATSVSALPSQSGNSGKFLTTNGTTASWANVSITPTAVSDQQNSSNGAFALPVGNTAQRPATAYNGYTRINSETSFLEVYYNSTWNSVVGIGYLSATGGTITTDGNYKIHTFTSSGNFTVNSITPNSYNIEYLVVAGGGGGGFQVGGGGGAGGLLYSSATTVSVGVYSIGIGAGGSGSIGGGANQTNGGNSTLGTLANSSTGAVGGGFGNNHIAGNYLSGAAGGSGGGGGGRNTGDNNGGAGTTGQGYAGGTGMTSNWAGGGGGGAGGVGANATNNFGGAGGVGLYYAQFAQWGTSNPNSYSASAGTALQNSGGWFAGGGGGSLDQQTSASSFALGGAGGGGRGYGNTGQAVGGSTHGEDGAPNTGGGGGGVRDQYGNATAYTRAGNGGSGVVIIRYRYQ